MSYQRWVFVAVLLFCLGLGLGLRSPVMTFDSLLEEIAGLGDLAASLDSLPPIGIFGLIFIRNISVLLISIAFSPFFCLVPSLALLVNGWVIGLVSVAVLQEKSLGYLLAGLLPHGILELPALFMGEAVAFSFGTAVVLAFFRKEKREMLIPGLKKDLRYLGIAFALLLAAAVIETWVTPLLLG
jgi:stage II sporulation protein M